jgi:hypothetical protein
VRPEPGTRIHTLLVPAIRNVAFIHAWLYILIVQIQRSRVRLPATTFSEK